MEPGDSEEVRLQKSLLVASSIMIAMAGTLWGSIYIAFDEPLAGSFPMSYAVASTINILVYSLTRHYRLFRNIQLILILLLPFLLQLALGGFISSSAAVLWCLLCPLGALMFGQRHHAIRWFLAFLGLVILGGILQPEMRQGNNLPSWLILMFFVGNISAISTIAFTLLYHFVSEKQEFLTQLETQAVTDPLTGLYNRTLLAETLEYAIHQSNRLNIPMTLATLDLDHFKKVNDTMGHDAGDKVLADIGKLLRNRIRRSDKIFRMGGEEFMILLYNTDTDQGLQVVEEIRDAIASNPSFPEHPVTASIGVATFEAEENRNQWMKRCDENLYRAKSNGRNQVAL